MDESSESTGAARDRAVIVWDLPTRVFHWLVVTAVLVGWITGGEKGWLFDVHRWNGYLIGAAVLFRLVWGFIGSRHSRFADFVVGWRGIRDHAAELLRFEAHPRTGHTPMGGWMIVTLLAVLALIASSGLFAAGPDGTGGPFATAIGARNAHLAGEIHETLFNMLLALVVVHIAGVLTEILLTRENLVRAMWNGRKRLPAAQAAAEPPPRHPLIGLAVFALAVAAVWFAVA